MGGDVWEAVAQDGGTVFPAPHGVQEEDGTRGGEVEPDGEGGGIGGYFATGFVDGVGEGMIGGGGDGDVAFEAGETGG